VLRSLSLALWGHEWLSKNFLSEVFFLIKVAYHSPQITSCTEQTTSQRSVCMGVVRPLNTTSTQFKLRGYKQQLLHQQSAASISELH